jgi:hypothetical protein
VCELVFHVWHLSHDEAGRFPGRAKETHRLHERCVKPTAAIPERTVGIGLTEIIFLVIASRTPVLCGVAIHSPGFDELGRVDPGDTARKTSRCLHNNKWNIYIQELATSFASLIHPHTRGCRNGNFESFTRRSSTKFRPSNFTLDCSDYLIECITIFFGSLRFKAQQTGKQVDP